MAESDWRFPISLHDCRKAQKLCIKASDQNFKGFDDYTTNYTPMHFDNYITHHCKKYNMFDYNASADTGGFIYPAPFTKESAVSAKMKVLMSTRDIYHLEMLISHEFLQNTNHQDCNMHRLWME